MKRRILKIIGTSVARILAVFAHPDDETIGCGGVIQSHLKHLDEVLVVFITSGDKGDFNSIYGNYNYSKIREEESQNACRLLGVEAPIFLQFPDQQIENGPRAYSLAKASQVLGQGRYGRRRQLDRRHAHGPGPGRQVLGFGRRPL